METIVVATNTTTNPGIHDLAFPAVAGKTNAVRGFFLQAAADPTPEPITVVVTLGSLRGPSGDPQTLEFWVNQQEAATSSFLMDFGEALEGMAEAEIVLHGQGFQKMAMWGTRG